MRSVDFDFRTGIDAAPGPLIQDVSREKVVAASDRQCGELPFVLRKPFGDRGVHLHVVVLNVGMSSILTRLWMNLSWRNSRISGSTAARP